jgi:hypothetical protein
MLLGTRKYATNDVRVIRVNYCDWLFPGYVLGAVTANITPTAGVASTVGPIKLDPSEKVAFIQLNCGPTVNEAFTLNVIATDTFGQTINDLLNVTIIAPGAA